MIKCNNVERIDFESWTNFLFSMEEQNHTEKEEITFIAGNIIIN